MGEAVGVRDQKGYTPACRRNGRRRAAHANLLTWSQVGHLTSDAPCVTNHSVIADDGSRDHGNTMMLIMVLTMLTVGSCKFQVDGTAFVVPTLGNWISTVQRTHAAWQFTVLHDGHATAGAPSWHWKPA